LSSGELPFGHHADRKIDLWHGSMDQSDWYALLGVLSEEERRRADAYVFERDARRFVVSHAVLRLLLSHSTGIAAPDLMLRMAPRSKPTLEGGISRPIHFSLSRSEERVLIGFASHPLGVDIEWLGRSLDIETLAMHVLSDRERDAIGRLDRRYHLEAFLRCWTQKEAYLKAIGEGLNVPPDDVEVSFIPGKEPGLKKLSGNANTAKRWFVKIVVPGDNYVGAVAIPGGDWHVEMTALNVPSFLLDERFRSSFV
jgi:4'-phosphopantetheinyl transferase